MIEHRDAARAVEQPEHRRIITLLISARHESKRAEARPWSALERRLFPDIGLKHQFPGADTANAFQCQLGMPQMIEDAIEENQIECPEAFGLKIVDIHQVRASIGLARLLDNIESANRIRKGIDSNHFARPPLFGFE